MEESNSELTNQISQLEGCLGAAEMLLETAKETVVQVKGELASKDVEVQKELAANDAKFKEVEELNANYAYIMAFVGAI